MTTALMANYARLDVQFARGDGVWLWDSEGKQYLDALAGIAVCGLGHAHPEVTQAIASQAASLVHTSNLYRIEVQERLAARLCELSGLERVFFCNSGAEANEAAIKIGRAYGRQRGFQTPQIIVANDSFHGRTLGALSATGNPKVHSGFEPLVAGFVHVPYDDAQAIADAVVQNPETSAVLLEPVLGEGGIVIPKPDYLQQVREICDRHELLLMLDEIQTGMGRTGRWFAFQHSTASPDVMTLAKALGNGVPIGACLARGVAAQVLQPGSHGSTFGGNPLACSAAVAVLEVMTRDGLVEKAAQRGRALETALADKLSGQNCVREIRSHGLMIAVELDRPCPDLVAMALERGLLLNVTAGSVIRMLPPLIIEPEHVERIATELAELVRDWNAQT